MCPKTQLGFLHYLIRNVLSLQRWTNMARRPSPGILIPVSIQRCSEENAMVEHPRIICMNVSVTAAVHRTCLQWQWDWSDRSSKTRDDWEGRQREAYVRLCPWCPLPGPVSVTIPSHFESHIDIP